MTLAVDRCALGRWRMLRWTGGKKRECSGTQGPCASSFALPKGNVDCNRLGEGGPSVAKPKISKCGFLIYKLLVSK